MRTMTRDEPAYVRTSRNLGDQWVGVVCTLAGLVLLGMLAAGWIK